MERPEAFANMGGFDAGEDPFLTEIDEVIALHDAGQPETHDPPLVQGEHGSSFHPEGYGNNIMIGYMSPDDQGFGGVVRDVG